MTQLLLKEPRQRNSANKNKAIKRGENLRKVEKKMMRRQSTKFAERHEY